jgi:hypothetical protein
VVVDAEERRYFWKDCMLRAHGCPRTPLPRSSVTFVALAVRTAYING